jgi:S1-C subfamily serine protease
VRRVAAAALAALAPISVGCSSGDADGGGGAPEKVTTTRVEVVEGMGRRGAFDPGAIYKRLSPGVVTVISIFEGGVLDTESGEGGQGSGFVLDGEGYVATNAHVVTTGAGPGADVEQAEQVFVEFSDGNRVPAEIVGDDPNADVALLQLETGGLSLTPLRLGTSESIEVGEPVAAIGSPFSENQSLSIGVVSAVDRNIESLTQFQIGNAVQTDAAINPGNSGGPLLDARGRVIGINAQIKSESGGGEGVGFAIPVDTVRRSLRELRRRGRVSYGYLGVTSLVLWPQAARRLRLDVRDGAVVERVEQGSPADKAGLRAADDQIEFQGVPLPIGGDVIVAVDGRRLTRTDDLADVISERAAGERVRLELLRDGERRTVEVRLGQRPLDSG